MAGSGLGVWVGNTLHTHGGVIIRRIQTLENSSIKLITLTDVSSPKFMLRLE